MSVNVAIDGPAGAGKSTIAKCLAGRLNYIYVDTGAMYRAIALYMLQKEIDTESLCSVEQACQEIDIDIVYKYGVQNVLLNGENVTGQIRTESVGNMASKISAIPAVRKRLLKLQRELAERSDVIMDGRDIGTCVLPAADVKIYLTAGTHVRALRRYRELQEKQQDTPSLEQIEADIADRDYRDMHREAAPLRQAEDAVRVDTSDMDITQVVDTLYTLIDERI